MKILVVGASGKTGSLVVEGALARVHVVTVLVRHASEYKQENVKVLEGDATNREDVMKAVSRFGKADGDSRKTRHCNLEPHEQLGAGESGLEEAWLR